MPNAAMFDDDLGYEPKPRKGAPRKPRTAAAGKKKGPKRKRFGMDRIARYAAIGMAATMALGIMVNALVLQKGHHPAPLFGKTAAAAPSQAAAPLPSVRAEPVEASAETAPAAAAKMRKTVVATRDADAPSGDDAIGRLLAGVPLPPPRSQVRPKAKARAMSKTRARP